MAHRGPTKDLHEICVRAISARPRRAFQLSVRDGAKALDDGGGADDGHGPVVHYESKVWQRALAMYQGAVKMRQRLRAHIERGGGGGGEGAGGDIGAKRARRGYSSSSDNFDDKEVTDDAVAMPNFRDLVSLKALLEMRMKKIGLIHDDSLPDDWYHVGPAEEYTLNLSKVQFTQPKIKQARR